MFLLLEHAAPQACDAGMHAVRKIAQLEEGQHPIAFIVGSGSTTHTPGTTQVQGTADIALWSVSSHSSQNEQLPELPPSQPQSPVLSAGAVVVVAALSSICVGGVSVCKGKLGIAATTHRNRNRNAQLIAITQTREVVWLENKKPKNFLTVIQMPQDRE